MAKAINMPQVGQDIETARIIEWHFKVGDDVREGDILATVESDKASFEVEVFDPGTILELLFEEGDEAEVFKPIAFIGEAGEKVGDESSTEKRIEKIEIEIPEIKEDLTQISDQQKNGKVFSSPSARRIAGENKIDLLEVNGSGPDGRIVKKDVLEFLKTKPVVKKASPLAKKIAEDVGLDYQSLSGSGYGGRVMKKDIIASAGKVKSEILKPESGDSVVVFNKTRKRIAERLSFSAQTIPHYYLFIDVNCSGAMLWRKKTNQELGLQISVNDIIIKAAADALKIFPEMNSHVDDEKMVLKPEINIGVAVSTPYGLLVPVIPETDKLNMSQTSEVSRKNAENARRGIVNFTKPGTFTISNLGMFGINKFLPIINPPECAILSVGSIEKKVVPAENEIKIIDNMTLGLACDHRAADGAKTSEFLNKIRGIIESYNDIN